MKQSAVPCFVLLALCCVRTIWSCVFDSALSRFKAPTRDLAPPNDGYRALAGFNAVVQAFRHHRGSRFLLGR